METRGPVIVLSAVVLSCGGDPTPAGVETVAPRAAHVQACSHVERTGNVLTVTPTGDDDTGNIQCAFDTAASLSGASVVRLEPGDFYVAAIVVYGFEGRFVGAGMHRSVIHNVQWPIPVVPVDFFLEWPTVENPWSSLLTFVGGDFSVADLGVEISGFPVTTGTTFSFWDLEPFTDLQFGLLAVGDGVRMTVERLWMTGEAAPIRDEQDPTGSLYGTNLINGVMIGGLHNYEAIGGALTVRNSEVRLAGTAIELMSLKHVELSFSGNTLGGTLDGINLMTGGDGIDLVAVNNDITAPFGIDFYDWGDPLPPLFDSRIRLVNNRLHGDGAGIDFAGVGQLGSGPTMGDDVACLMANNDVTDVTGPGIALGPGIHGCVVTATPIDRVLDLGSDNVILPPAR